MSKKFIHHTVLPFARKIRAQVVKTIKPKSGYSLMPISDKFGFDRGKPIDRYYIDTFIELHQEKIHGRCLEVHDDAYIKRFGGNRVTQGDVVDIDTSNKLANIYTDLSAADVIAENTYDTLIVTQTLGLIPEHEKAVGHLYRILKPGGTLLMTVSTMGPWIKNGNGYWRYSIKSLPYLLEKFFKKENIKADTYGNALTGQAFWVGMAVEEFTKEQLDFKDERFPIIVTAVATK